jgi:hypothetical protein
MDISPAWGVLASFIGIFLRAFQQQNVVGAHYRSAALTSYGLAVSDVATIGLISTHGWHMVPWIGTGAAVGVVASMYVHRKLFKRK